MSARLEFRIVPKLGQVRFLRSEIRAAFHGTGWTAPRLDRLVLVVDEMVTNAIEHGRTYRRAGDELVLRLTVNGAALELEFEDPSATPEVVGELVRMLAEIRSGGLPPVYSERGRGLFLIEGGLESFAVEGRTGGGMRMSGRLVAG